MLNRFDYLMYFLIFISALIIAQVERKDNMCSDPWDPNALCDGSSGMPFRGTKPSDSDSCPVLLEKIQESSDSENKIIKWRRSFTISVILSIAIFSLIVTPRKLPPWQTFYLSTAVMFAVLYFSFNYYSYHILSISKKHIRDSINHLYNKGCITL